MYAHVRVLGLGPQGELVASAHALRLERDLVEFALVAAHPGRLRRRIHLLFNFLLDDLLHGYLLLYHDVHQFS